MEAAGGGDAARGEFVLVRASLLVLQQSTGGSRAGRLGLLLPTNSRQQVANRSLTCSNRGCGACWPSFASHGCRLALIWLLVALDASGRSVPAFPHQRRRFRPASSRTSLCRVCSGGSLLSGRPPGKPQCRWSPLISTSWLSLVMHRRRTAGRRAWVRFGVGDLGAVHAGLPRVIADHLPVPRSWPTDLSATQSQQEVPAGSSVLGCRDRRHAQASLDSSQVRLERARTSHPARSGRGCRPSRWWPRPPRAAPGSGLRVHACESGTSSRRRRRLVHKPDGRCTGHPASFVPEDAGKYLVRRRRGA
jgi:hypothetical protein